MSANAWMLEQSPDHAKMELDHILQLPLDVPVGMRGAESGILDERAQPVCSGDCNCGA